MPTWTGLRVQHVRHHATRGIFASHGWWHKTFRDRLPQWAHNQTKRLRCYTLNCSCLAVHSSLFVGTYSAACRNRKMVMPVVIITNRYSRLTLTVPTSKARATHTASIFYDHWIILYSIASYLLTRVVSQFLTKFYKTVCYFPGVKQLKTTIYQPLTNDQPEQCKRTMISKLRHFVAAHHFDLDNVLQLVV